MKRIKRHKVKTEAPETSTSQNREQEVHDLAYYIHDRVELMHQVFSVLKYKELKAMVPACIRNISIDDLQELCTEELLGISSKRLLAILDGAEPPSDTESSSPSPPPEQLETISLDSISSDDEILSQGSSKKKKHKHRRHSSKSKSKRDNKKTKQQDEEDAERSKASRAGLTVLELLELQARARAIRAQLQQEQQRKPPSESKEEATHSSDNEVEIKEEPPEVVEISSDEEKPKIEELDQMMTKTAQTVETPQPAPVTKRINDLIITVPQKTKQKIKLNRTKSTPSNTATEANITSAATTQNEPSVATVQPEVKSKPRKKKKKKDSKKYDVDNDEITLQLSDSEKMDLLEDLDRKNYESVSSCSDSSESSSDSDTSKKDKSLSKKDDPKLKQSDNNDKRDSEVDPSKDTSKELLIDDSRTIVESSDCQKPSKKDKIDEETKKNNETSKISKETEVIKENDSIQKDSDKTKDTSEVLQEQNDIDKGTDSQPKDTEKKLSEGELSDAESSEVEAVDLNPEVVCISDEEGKKSKKKKKKKSKKSKKSDFHRSADENFYKESTEKVIEKKSVTAIDNPSITDEKDKAEVTGNNPIDTNVKEEGPTDEIKNKTGKDSSDDYIYEIMELSDDSSDVECTILSKEPTTSEIEALSAKIDAIERVEVITEDEIKEYERMKQQETEEELENISWKDRYLDSTKVKKVLNTANILNALRKKNIELKKKLAESREEKKEDTAPEEKEQVLEGTIEHYNTLESSTKYVDPVKEVTKDLKKDAKILLKMYKKLLKYNDINRPKDPNKKKKKKRKKISKDKDSCESKNE